MSGASRPELFWDDVGDHDEVQVLSRKLQARIVLADGRRKMIVPTREEWIGINLLERDGELL